MLSTSRIRTLAIFCFLLLCATANAYASNPSYGVFTNPQAVTIEGYTQDAMEPFISPDGNYLFFNNSNGAPDTNLYYATRIDDLTWQFQGEIGGVNSSALDAVASMDLDGNFYFISTRSYAGTFSTIYSGTLSDGNVTGIALVQGISKQKAGDVNFDACISPDGNTLYFDDGVYTSDGDLLHASIAIATRTGDQFTRLKKSATIMRKINLHGLNYAPDISASGLEFFFTRFDGTLPAIYTATRSKTSKPFSKPRKIKAITGFV